MGPHIHGSSSVDSLMDSAQQLVTGEKKKPTYKWTGAVQTGADDPSQGPTVRIYLATCLLLNKNTT